MPGRSLPFQLGQSSTAIKNSTGWPAASIAGDNPTPGYVHIPGGMPGWQWVFPFTYGFVYPIRPASMAPVTFTTKDTPPGFPPAQAYTSQAMLALLEDALPPSPGTRAQGSQGPVQYLGSIAFVGGQSSNSPTVPPGTVSLMVRNLGPSITGFRVSGNVTNNQYWPAGGAGAATFTTGSNIVFPFDSARDPVAVMQGNNNSTLEVSAFFAPEAVVAYPWLAGAQASSLSQSVVLASDIAQEIGVLGWALPGGGSRWRMTATGNLAVGTYTVDIPMWNAGLQDSFAASGTMTAAHSGVNPASGRALLYCKVGANAGGGTVTFTITSHDADTGNNLDILSTVATGLNGTAVLRVAPGIAVVANQTASDLIGLTPRVKFVVATAAQGFTATLDLV